MKALLIEIGSPLNEKEMNLLAAAFILFNALVISSLLNRNKRR